MRNFYLVGGNCPRSRQDAQTIINYFLLNRIKQVKKIKDADIIIIYSCGGFNSGEIGSLEALNEVLEKKSSKAIVVFTGCLPKINIDSIPENLRNTDSIKIMNFEDFPKIDQIINATIGFKEVPDAGIIKNIPMLGKSSTLSRFFYDLKINPRIMFNIFNNLINKHNEYDSRFYHVRVSRGCLCNCSYCAIKLSRGKLKSSTIDEIKKDLEEGIKRGYNNFVLVGEDTGCYGLDIGKNSVDLLKIFFDYKQVKKLMINDFNPQWLIRYYNELEKLFIENKNRIEDFRVPIQSGSNKILKLMKRPYNINDVKDSLIKIKSKIPELKIHTHIIVGFPGETEEDFKESCELLKEIKFYKVIFYPYENRHVTESSKLQDKLPEDLINQRLKIIKKYA